ncbi:MAG: 4Fe-4S dicluster domain-containing protein [Deltaproteobacteria bacterium]|nr:4Fe-4S dicluster domain-containing protein [Deltaproteobacteria bacterium]
MKVISKKDWEELLRRLSGERAIWAPRLVAGRPLFGPVGEVEQIDPGHVNTLNPAKVRFFPHTETILRFRKEKEGIFFEPPPREDAKALLFGVRPCDARSFVMLDKLFLEGEYRDPYYAEKRENSLVVGIGCNLPLRSCFCTSVGGGPFGTEGLDVLLTDLGDEYLAEACTAGGEELLGTVPRARDCGESDTRRRQELEAACRSRMDPVDLLEGVKTRLDSLYDNPFWDTLFLKCIACGNCTYHCPTCHCFDIVEEAGEEGGRRLRNWDSCMYPLFTLHASGHNPRPTGKERWRQRLMHKFRYYVENFGVSACVGCGRCIINCPVNMDIRRILMAVQELDIPGGAS